MDLSFCSCLLKLPCDIERDRYWEEESDTNKTQRNFMKALAYVPLSRNILHIQNIHINLCIWFGILKTFHHWQTEPKSWKPNQIKFWLLLYFLGPTPSSKPCQLTHYVWHRTTHWIYSDLWYVPALLEKYLAHIKLDN